MSYCRIVMCFFFFNDTATTEIYTLSLHDALPIFRPAVRRQQPLGEPEAQIVPHLGQPLQSGGAGMRDQPLVGRDRKSTRLNSSHANISYAVFCLKKKKEQ